MLGEIEIKASVEHNHVYRVWRWRVSSWVLTLLARRVDPRQVGEVRVGGGGDHFAADLAEVVRALRERDDLGGADESAGNHEMTY